MDLTSFGDCSNKEKCCKYRRVEIQTASQPELPTTRNGMIEMGVAIAQNADMDDNIVVELTYETEPWMIGQVLLNLFCGYYTYTYTYK